MGLSHRPARLQAEEADAELCPRLFDVELLLIQANISPGEIESFTRTEAGVPRRDEEIEQHCPLVLLPRVGTSSMRLAAIETRRA